jgi:TP901 family phage tail tape measure protein
MAGFKAGSIFVDSELRDSGFRTGINKLGRIAKVGGALIGAALAGGFVVAVRKADEFQRSMANVSTVIDTTVISTHALTKELLMMDPALGSTTELTEGLYQAFSAGAETAEDALRVTTDSAMFAAAALTETATAVDVLTTAENAYGAEIVNTTQASDIFFQTIKLGKITGEQLAGSIGQSIPLFASTGIQLEELASGMAAMTKQGIAANEATTQLNAIVNAFLQPTDELAGLMTELGYASGSAFLEAEGLAGALELVEDATAGDAAEIARLIPNIRGMRGAMALTGQGGDIFRDTLVEMGSAAGSTAEAFEKQEKTWETFRNTLDRTSIIVGNIGKAFLDEIAEGATIAATKVNEFLMSGRAAELFGHIVGQLAGAFSAVRETMAVMKDDVMPTFAELQGTIAEEMESISFAGGEAASGFDILGGITSLLSAGFKISALQIKAVVSVLGEAITASQAAAQAMGNLFRVLSRDVTWADVRQGFQDAVDAYGNLGAAMQEATLEFGEEALEVWANVRDQSIENSGRIETAYVHTTSRVGGAFESMWDTLITGQDGITDHVDETVDRQVYAWEALAEQSGGAFGVIGEAAEETSDEVLEAFEETVNAASSIVSTASQIWDSTFGALFDALSDREQARLDKLEASFDRERGLLDEQRDNGLLSQEQYDANLEALEEGHQKKMDKIGEKKFKADKRSKIAGVWMDAARSIAGWWAAAPQLGFPLGPIVASAMTAGTVAMATAQTVSIGKQNYTPAFAEGGTFRGGGTARINEEGGEIVKLPDGTVIVPHDLSRDIASGSGGITVNAYFDGARISSEMELDMIVDRVVRKAGRMLRQSA